MKQGGPAGDGAVGQAGRPPESDGTGKRAIFPRSRKGGWSDHPTIGLSSRP